MAPTDDDIVATGLQVLAEHGPVTTERLLELMAAAGVETTELGLTPLLGGDGIAFLVGDRVARFDGLLAGKVLTHRLTDDEVDLGVLDLSPDLAAVRGAEELTGLDLADGEPLDHLHLGTAGRCALDGPDGWLDGLAAGDVVACRAEGGVLSLERIDEADLAPLPDGAAERIVAVATELGNNPDFELPVDQLHAGLLDAEPDWFARPGPPFGELLDAAGIERHGERVGAAGHAWDLVARTERIDRAGQVFGLGLDALVEVEAAVVTALAEHPSDDDLGRAARTIADLDRARAVELVLVAEDTGPAALTGLGLALAERPDTSAAVRATALWLAASGAERSGALAEAGRLLARAVDVRPSFQPAAEALAPHAEARGDAKDALRLYGMAGYDNDEPVVLELRELIARTKAPVGRNDPCPCGSGRKYKQCHAGREEVPPRLRAGWLWRRAGRHAARRAGAELLDIASALVGPEVTGRMLLGIALGDELVADLALHEGGWFGRYLDTWQDVLADADRALGATWRAVPRTVATIEGAQRGETVTVRDRRTGATVTVRDRSASRTATPGDTVLVRVVQDAAGEPMLLGAGAVVQAGRADDLLALLDSDPTAVRLASAIRDART